MLTLGTISADILSINSYGSQDYVIIPTSNIEGFFFKEASQVITIPPGGGGGGIPIYKQTEFPEVPTTEEFNLGLFGKYLLFLFIPFTIIIIIFLFSKKKKKKLVD